MSPFNWTDELPTIPGVYWHRDVHGEIHVGQVEFQGEETLVYFIGDEEAHIVEMQEGEWLGPIPRPD